MQNPRAKQAYDFFMSRGYSSAQAAGIVGNLLGESGLNPIVPAGDGGLAKGIGQWHPDRWARHLSNAAKAGQDPNDLNSQLEFVDWELRNTETKAFNNLMKAKTVDQATAAFLGFERPQGFTYENPYGAHNYSGRKKYADDVYAAMNGVAPPAGLSFAQQDPQQPTVPNAPYEVPTSAGVQPNRPATLAEQLEAQHAAEAKAKENETSLWQGVQDAVGQDWSLSYLFRNKPDMAPDADFRMTTPVMKELTKDVPEEFWDRFTDAHSQTHAEYIRKTILDDMAAQQRLAGMGMGGIALRLAAGATDPLAWAAAAGISLATGGLAAPEAFAARFGKMGMVARSAIEGALGNVASDSIIVANNGTAHASDLLWSAGGGLIFGGAFGALARNPATKLEARQIEDIGRKMRNSTALTPDSSAGAMQISPREDLRATTADIVRDGAEAAPKAFAKGWRFDLAGYLKGSDNMLTRIIGNHLVEDGARNVDGVTPIGASEWQSLLNRRAEVKWRRGFDTAFNEYAQRTGVSLGGRDAARGDFATQVTQFVWNRDSNIEFDPAVVKAGTTFRGLMKQWAEYANNPGALDGTIRRPLRGAENLLANDHYVPHIFNHGAIQDGLAKYGHKTLTRLFSDAFREVAQDMTPELADKMAAGYVKRMQSLSAGELFNANRAFSGEDLDELRTMLEQAGGLSAEELETIVTAFKPKPQDGATPRLKHRMLYNEEYGAHLRRTDGSADDYVKLSDFLVKDADFLMTAYSRQMSGRVAMGRLQVANPKWKEGDEAPRWLIDGITSDGEWHTLKEEVRSVADSTGSLKNLKKDLERLDFGYNSIIGRPNFDEGSDWSQFLRLSRDYNFTRVMNQVGFAQLPELANVTSQLGWRAMLSNMPSLRSMWRDAKTGQLNDAIAEEIEDTLTVGTDWLRHNTHTPLDDFGNPLGGLTENKLVQGADKLLAKGKRITSAVSGMAPANVFLQRVTGKAIFNKFAILAKQGGATATRRMQALGLTQAMLDRVTGQINQHAKFKPGVAGERLELMNLKAWDDHEARAAFEMAAFRMSRSIIQENDLGNMSKWMSSPVMRTVLQFRSFMLAAWSKQFLQGLNFHDGTTVAAWGTSLFMAGATYMARTYLNSVGRSDRDEYLAKRLDPLHLATASLQNSSWFSILAPGVDTAWTFLGNESLFNGRNTQLASSALWGNPSADLANKAIEVGKHARDIATGKGNQNDARNLWALVPFNNAMGLNNLFGAMISGMPD